MTKAPQIGLSQPSASDSLLGQPAQSSAGLFQGQQQPIGIQSLSTSGREPALDNTGPQTSQGAGAATTEPLQQPVASSSGQQDAAVVEMHAIRPTTSGASQPETSSAPPSLPLDSTPAASGATAAVQPSISASLPSISRAAASTIQQQTMVRKIRRPRDHTPYTCGHCLQNSRVLLGRLGCCAWHVSLCGEQEIVLL